MATETRYEVKITHSHYVTIDLGGDYDGWQEIADEASKAYDEGHYTDDGTIRDIHSIRKYEVL